MGRLGHSVALLVGLHLSPMAYSSYVSKCVRVHPSANSVPARASAIAAMVSEVTIDAVIAASHRDARVVAEAHARFSGH